MKEKKKKDNNNKITGNIENPWKALHSYIHMRIANWLK